MNSETSEGSRLTLPGGRYVHIRALRRGEDRVVQKLFARLGPRTRYLRFHTPTAFLPESLLRTLTEVDNCRRLALVAELDEPDSGDAVGLGNVAVRDDKRAEVGLVVADVWQRRGIGVALATRLLRAAEERGHERFMTHELWDNPALRPLLRHVGDVVSIEMCSGISEITFVRRRSPLERAYDRILAARGGLLTSSE